MRISDWSSDVCSSDLADPPIGFFEVLRPAPENLAQRPETDTTDDRTRHGSIPRLARLLWRLMMLSGLNHCPPLRDEDPERSISREFQRLAFAAARVAIAPGIELGRAFRSEEHTSALQSLMRISY